jgi:hypothetical protein
MKRLPLLIVLILLIAAPTIAAHEFLEKEYQTKWCSERGGIQEYRLDDATRVDCLLPEFAVEFDFAYKWAECIGQAFYYGQKTGRKAACVLIIEDQEKEKQFVERLKIVCEKMGIKYWLMYKEDLGSE